MSAKLRFPSYQRSVSEMDLWTSIAPDVQQVFKDLNLTQYFPGKITAQTARLRGRSDAKELSHIAWQFLENVLSLLYKGKGDFFQIAKTNVDTGMENLVSVKVFQIYFICSGMGFVILYFFT